MHRTLWGVRQREDLFLREAMVMALTMFTDNSDTLRSVSRWVQKLCLLPDNSQQHKTAILAAHFGQCGTLYDWIPSIHLCWPIVPDPLFSGNLIEYLHLISQDKIQQTRSHQWQKDMFSLFRRLEGQDPNVGCNGFSWGFSPRLAHGCLLPLSPHGLLSVCMSPATLSFRGGCQFYLNRALPSWPHLTIITSLKALSLNSIILAVSVSAMLGSGVGVVLGDTTPSVTTDQSDFHSFTFYL